MDIDIIIPVYKPGKALFMLIERLEKQTLPFQNIILMNTEEKYFEQLIFGTRFLEQHRKVKVFHLSKREFDHGRTRNVGVHKSRADIFVMMTQDALPADEHLLEELTRNLSGNVAVSYARQLPAQDCNEIEKFMRIYNYPHQSRIKTEKDLPQLGIKTFFCSNVCAAYRRDIYDELGGFIRHTIFNEDMIFAAGAVKSGYAIAYESGAQVIHSHNYSNRQQFRRNFDLGVSQADHPEVFAHIVSESEGRKMVGETKAYLKQKKMKGMIPRLYFQSACKYAGYLLGKNYRKLPRKWTVGFSMNKEYWNQEGRRRDVAGIDAARGYGRTEDETQKKNRYE